MHPDVKPSYLHHSNVDSLATTSHPDVFYSSWDYNFYSIKKVVSSFLSVYNYT